MIKKKLNILLLLSLALLFTSLLGTTSFAKTLTENELKNFIWNAAYKYGASYEDRGAYADSIVNAFSNLPNANDNTDLEINRWLNICNNLYEGYYILTSYNATVTLWRYNKNNNNQYGPYFYSNNVYVNSSYQPRWKTSYDFRSPNNLTTTTSDYVTIDGTLGAFFYTDTNIYTNYVIANGSVKYPAGYMTPSNIFDGPFTNSRFTYTMSELDPETAEIDLNNTFWPSETAQQILFVYNPFSGNEINDARSSNTRLFVRCRPIRL